MQLIGAAGSHVDDRHSHRIAHGRSATMTSGIS
jgi:hypothetical protein